MEVCGVRYVVGEERKGKKNEEEGNQQIIPGLIRASLIV
jgi:hypothetical protein